MTTSQILAAPVRESDSHTVELPNGMRVLVSPAEPADVPQVRAMYTRISPETVYLRHFARFVPRGAAERLCGLPASQGHTLLARLPDPDPQVVGYAHYVVTDPHPRLQAEAALVVEDRYQGRGLGGILFERVVHTARRHGVRLMELNTLENNIRALRTFGGLDLPCRALTADGVTTLRLDLSPGPILVHEGTAA